MKLKSGELFKLSVILLGILLFGGLLTLSISSTIWSFLAEHGIELSALEESATILLVIIVIAATTHSLVKKPDKK